MLIDQPHRDDTFRDDKLPAETRGDERLIAVIMVPSIVLAEPMNSKFRRLPEGQVAEGVEQLRIIWRRFHWARTVVALGALACLAVASA